MAAYRKTLRGIVFAPGVTDVWSEFESATPGLIKIEYTCVRVVVGCPQGGTPPSIYEARLTIGPAVGNGDVYVVFLPVLFQSHRATIGDDGTPHDAYNYILGGLIPFQVDPQQRITVSATITVPSTLSINLDGSIFGAMV